MISISFIVFLYLVAISVQRNSAYLSGNMGKFERMTRVMAKITDNQYKAVHGNVKEIAVDKEKETIQDSFRGAPYVSKSGVGIKLESSPALVLNADFTPLSHMPLSLWYWQDALKAVLTGKATVVNAYNIRVRSVRTEYKLPSVIALTEYQKIPSTTPPLSRRNIYIRDGFRCQYCLMTLPPDDLTLDHVIPRAKGGKLTWTNTVAACRSCNVKKSDYLPDDLPRLGMRLRNPPKVPTYYELQSRAKNLRIHHVHPHWEDYINI